MATIRDVAREAGVSIATVSRVFNESSLVSADTTQTVREVAAKLHYWPNGVARSLITNKTHALGVLLPDIHGEFFSEVIRGADLAARANGFHLLVSSSHADSEALGDALRMMSGRIDGVIVMAPDIDAPAAIASLALSCPTVLLNPGQAVDQCDTISISNFQGAHDMTRHLLGLGHTRIAIVRGPQHNLDAVQRLQGYRAALREAGIEPCEALEFPGNFTEPSGYEVVQSVLRAEPRASALFVANDHMAVGVVSALHDAGVHPPTGMAVAGFDDIAMARYLSPSLTTVRVNTALLGERAVDLLLRRQREPKAGARHHELLPTTLVVRGSCGALKPNDLRLRRRASDRLPAGKEG